jgi:hypothetical protein
MNMIILYDDVPCRRFRGSMDLWNVCQFLQDYMAQHYISQPSQKRNTFIFSPAEILCLITKVFCTSTVVTTNETHALERKLTLLMCVEVSYVKWSLDTTFTLFVSSCWVPVYGRISGSYLSITYICTSGHELWFIQSCTCWTENEMEYTHPLYIESWSCSFGSRDGS